MIYVLSGGTKVFAVINVTYPAGSTCTCTNGTKTLTLKDTSGQGFFMIPYAATWTVKCYNGVDYSSSEHKKSKNVKITSEGQSESVVLSYQLVLFNNGVVSGYAWSSSNNNSYGDGKVSNGLIYLYGQTGDNNISLQPGWGEIGISSAIGLSDYSTLKVRLNKTDGAEGTAKIQVGTTALGDNTATKTVTLTAGTTTSLDISSITGNKYISLYAQSDPSTFNSIIKAYFDKVWLE